MFIFSSHIPFHLDTGGGTYSKSMTAFAKAIVKAEIDCNGFLSLPSGMNFPGMLISKLYIRPCYEEIYDLILRMPRVLVTGTPGTGKSIWLWWIMYCALQADPELVIIWESVSEPDVRIMFKAGQGFRGSKISFEDEMMDSRTWLVIIQWL